MKRLFILFVTGALCVQTVNADNLKKVVIANTKGDVEESLKSVFMNSLTTGLTNSGQFEVLVNRQEYAQIITGEIAAQESGLIDDAQWLEFGRAHGAEYIIYPRIDSFDNQYFITIGFINATTGRAEKTINPITATRSQVIPKAIELATILSGGGMSEKKIISENDIRCNELSGSGYIESKDNRSSSWYDASQYCENKGVGWRLPTQKELIQIFSSMKRYGRAFENTTYWTSDKRNNFSVYTIMYPDRSITYESCSSECKFRCVYN